MKFSRNAMLSPFKIQSPPIRIMVRPSTLPTARMTRLDAFFTDFSLI